MTRPSDQNRSFIIQWRGNVPVVETSNWAVDYTPGHRESPEAAIAMEMIKLTDHIASFREKWLQINLLAEKTRGPGLSGVPDQTFDVPDPNAQLLDPLPEPIFEWDDPRLSNYEVRGSDGSLMGYQGSAKD